MALGAFFSAAEVIPLTFLTVEAWTFPLLFFALRYGSAARWPGRLECIIQPIEQLSSIGCLSRR
jgi:nitric oxide reductase large subunit